MTDRQRTYAHHREQVLPQFAFELHVLAGEPRQVLEILIANGVNDSLRDEHVVGAHQDTTIHAVATAQVPELRGRMRVTVGAPVVPDQTTGSKRHAAVDPPEARYQ